MSQDLFTGTVTVATGQTISAAYRLNGEHLVNIFVPSGMTGATITFQGSQDNATFQALSDENGNTVTVQSGASRAIKLPPNLVYGWNWIKLVIPSTLGADVSPTLGSRRYR